ncbi:MAG: beta-ketoacyl-[acyl-carrier-protein] synthase family protein, partial [Planctomycetota bacterium]
RLEQSPVDGVARPGAEVEDFDPLALLPGKKKFLKVMSRDVQLGVAAAHQAMAQSGLSAGSVDPDRLGVTFGAGRMSPRPEDTAQAVAACRRPDGEVAPEKWAESGMEHVAPLWLIPQLPNMAACHISIDFDARGPNNTITCRESSALLSLSEAVAAVRRGAADAMIVGGCGASTHPLDVAKLSLFDGLSRRFDDPTHACRPFDFGRDGTVVGEGAAAFVVEDYDHAVRRGAEILVEVLGVGAGSDGRGFSNEASGLGLVRAIEGAFGQAGVERTQLGHVNAHGKSTQRDDVVEARAYQTAFGSAAEAIPITALKSYFGHCDAGGGAIELAGSFAALRHGLLPATLNYETPDPRCPLNIVHSGPRRLTSSLGMSVNRTAVGQSAAAVFRAA